LRTGQTKTIILALQITVFGNYADQYERASMTRITFNFLHQLAVKHGFIFERINHMGRYSLCTNNQALGLGQEAIYQTLTEAWSDMHQLNKNRNPLNGQALPTQSWALQ
jgi:hypothetical protein